MDTTQLIEYIGALLVGIVLGLIGGGGSILTVPLFVYLLGLNPIVATAYSLFVVGTTSIAGVFQKYKKGLVDFKIGLMFSFPSFIAVYVTRRYLMPWMPDIFFNKGDFLLTKNMGIMIFFAVIMLIASISMIRDNKDEKILQTKLPYYKVFIQGLTIGTITGIIGAGGGFLYVPALVIWANIPMKKAVGTSLVIVSINSLIGFSGDVQTLDIEWVFLLTFTFISIIGIVLGIYFSKFVSSNKLKKSFGILILIMAAYIIFKELW